MTSALSQHTYGNYTYWNIGFTLSVLIVTSLYIITKNYIPFGFKNNLIKENSIVRAMKLEK